MMGEMNLYPFQLVDVRLFEASITRYEPDDIEKTGGENIRLSIGQKFLKYEKEDKLLSALLIIDIKGPVDRSPEFQINFTLEGLFQASIDFDEIDDEVWQEFKDRSSIMLLWPYAREYAQEFSTRMREDLPILPTFSLLQVTERVDEEVVVNDVE